MPVITQIGLSPYGSGAGVNPPCTRIGCFSFYRSRSKALGVVETPLDPATNGYVKSIWPIFRLSQKIAPTSQRRQSCTGKLIIYPLRPNSPVVIPKEDENRLMPGRIIMLLMPLLVISVAAASWRSFQRQLHRWLGPVLPGVLSVLWKGRKEYHTRRWAKAKSRIIMLSIWVMAITVPGGVRWLPEAFEPVPVHTVVVGSPFFPEAYCRNLSSLQPWCLRSIWSMMSEKISIDDFSVPWPRSLLRWFVCAFCTRQKISGILNPKW